MKNNTVWKFILVVLSVILTLASLPFLLIGFLYIAWSTPNYWLVIVVMILVLLLFTFIWVNIITYILKDHLANKKWQIIMFLPILLCGSLWGGYKLYENYQNRFIKVSTEIDLELYKPFRSDLLAELDEKATLRMEDPLPKLDGATAFYPMYAAFVQAVYPEKIYDAYDEKTDRYNDEIVCSTTPWAYDSLSNRRSDLIFVFEPDTEQQKMFDDANQTLNMTPIGKESFVFFVNAKNPVDALSQQQVRDIYSGKITNWKEVGGNDENILPYQRPEGSGSQTALLKMMKDSKVMEPEKENVAEGMGGIISQTADYRNRENAIGYSFRFFAEEMVNNKEIKLLKIDGITPTKESVRDDSYPFIFPFYAVHLNSIEHSKIDLMLEWIKSDQGKELIEKSGYVAY